MLPAAGNPREYAKVVVRALRASGVLVQGIIGEGVYGFVLATTNADTQRPEAIKVMPPYKRCGVMPVNALREVTALTCAQHHNVASSKGVLVFEDGTTAIRMSMYNCTLRSLLEQHHRYFLPFDVVQYLFSEIVKGVAAMSADFGLVHRDLKPENVLIRWAGKQVAVADWGMSRSGVGTVLPSDTVFTREVVSKYYAPPETLAGTGMYTSTIDVWSLGVMLAELIAGKMIFPQPMASMSRRDFIVHSVFPVLGTPVAPNDIDFFKKTCRIDVKALPGARRASTLLHRMGRPVPENLLHLLQQMLKYTNRPSIQELAASEYVQASGFPVAGVPFSSCVTTPRILESVPDSKHAEEGVRFDTKDSSLLISVAFPCASRDAAFLHQRSKAYYNTLHGWNVSVFDVSSLYRAWSCLQSLGTIRQRTHVWLVAAIISRELSVDADADSDADADIASTPTPTQASAAQYLLAATISLAAASVMLVQRRFELPFVKCIQPMITATSLHAAECIVFQRCQGYLPVCPLWASHLKTPAAMHIACESVCHGPEIEAVPIQDFIAACHCHAEEDELEASSSAEIASGVGVALQTLKDLRKRIHLE